MRKMFYYQGLSRKPLAFYCPATSKEFLENISVHITCQNFKLQFRVINYPFFVNVIAFLFTTEPFFRLNPSNVKGSGMTVCLFVVL